MFEILDGRGAFWQWDLNQKLIVNDLPLCSEVHFCNGTKDCALVTLVKTIDEKKVCDVPNEILQTAGYVKVYAYVKDDDEQYTEVRKSFPVLERTKPEDYIYTETETLNYKTLAAEIGELSKLETEAKNNLVSAINEARASGGPGTDLSLGLTSASVGQIIKVKAVDEDGKPTQWEAAEMPSGDKWELINEITFSESANGCVINTDSNGAAFSLKAVKVECVIQIDESDPFTHIKAKYNNLTVSTNASNSNKSGQVYYSCGALWMGLAGIMSIQNKSCMTQNYNWGYSVEKIGFHYNNDWKQNSISQIKIEPNDGGKPLGAGTKIYVYGVRA